MNLKKILFNFLLILTTQQFYASFLIPERHRILMDQGFSRIQSQNLAYAADTDTFDSEGFTTLHKIFIQNPTNIPMIKAFLKVGANINAQDGHGDTILHMAIKNFNENETKENFEMIKFLLDPEQTDADIDILNKNHKSSYSMNPKLIQNIVAEQHAIKHDEALNAYTAFQQAQNLTVDKNYPF